jgi:hypothetical protein
MRVSVLKENLVSPCFICPKPQRGHSITLENRGWGSLAPRAPFLVSTTYKKVNLEMTNPLDQGFFFPLPSYEPLDGIPYKKFIIGSRKQQRPSDSTFRVASY